VVASSSGQRCANPPLEEDSCGFYSDCLEAAHPCGPTGYALGFGDKYCRRFLNSEQEGCFDAPGAVWVNSTVACLQEVLVPLTQPPLVDTEDCKEIKQTAFASHADCYTGGGGINPTAPSVCFLGASDMRCVFGVIDLKDLVRPLGLQSEVKVVETCLLQLAHAGIFCRRDHHHQDEEDEDERCGFWKGLLETQ